MADSAFLLLLTGIALVISGMIQATLYGLTVYHGLVLLALSWLTLLAAIPPFLTVMFHSYPHMYDEDGHRNRVRTWFTGWNFGLVPPRTSDKYVPSSASPQPQYVQSHSLLTRCLLFLPTRPRYLIAPLETLTSRRVEASPTPLLASS